MVIQEYKEPGIKKYLGYGYWYADNEEKIRRIVKIALIVFAVLAWLIFFFNLLKYLLAEAGNKTIGWGIIEQRSDYEAINKAQAPALPQFGDVSVFPSGENLADFAVTVTNPNPRWRLELDYKFVWPAGETVSQRSVVLPNEKNVLTAAGVTANSLPANPDLQFEIIRWERVKNQPRLDFAEEARNNLEYSDVVVGGGSGFSIAKYTVTNNGLYTILDPKFLVVAAGFNGQPVAIGINSDDKIESGETLTFEYRWIYDLPASVEAEIFPLIDFFDGSIYQLESGEGMRF